MEAMKNKEASRNNLHGILQIEIKEKEKKKAFWNKCMCYLTAHKHSNKRDENKEL